MNMNQSQQYNMNYGAMRGQNNVPPPPPREENSLVSATFVPAGNSFGPGVGIPALDDFSSFSLEGYDPGAYADHNLQNTSVYNNGNSAHSAKSASGGPDMVTREMRAASVASQRPKFPQLRENNDPLSPGPPTATLMNPNQLGRPRAQSAMVPQQSSTDIANQWPMERILIWLAANGFSNEWQETFRKLRLEKAEFLDLGRSGDKRSNLSRMHQFIYPQLAKECQLSGIDVKKERRDGERLQRLVSGISQGGDTSSSAGTGHRRRESGLQSGLQSASSEGNVENSPRLTNSTTPSSSGPEGSPARQFGPGFGPRSTQERSSTLPVFPKQTSSASTPAEPRHMESFGPPTGRTDYTRGVLNGIGNRGRHSPNLSGDSTTIATRHEASPGQSPALGHSVPSQAQSNSNLPSQAREPSKAQSVDSFQKATGFTRNGGPGNIVTTEVPLSSRYYEGRQEIRSDNQRAYSNDLDSKEHNKGFFSKFIRGKKHEFNEAVIEEVPPTSPRDLLQKLPFTKQHGNFSDTSLVQHPPSATLSENERGLESMPKRQPRRYVMVTPDYWNYRLVDVTNIESAKALREKIGHELGVDDMAYAQIYVTEPGRKDHDEALSDAMLAAARSGADPSASLKFYVKSPTLSAGTVSQADGLGLHTTQSRTQRDAIGRQLAAMSNDDLRKAAEAYRDENEKKRMAYLENRQTRRGVTSDSGTPVYDFDAPSPSTRSGFPDEKKPEAELVPHRKPPAAPSASQMLTKVNSLRMNSQHRSKGSLDNSRKNSDTLYEEPSPRNKRSFDPSSSIGAAIANSSKVAAIPAAVSGRKSPRTVTIGNSYVDDNDTIRPQASMPKRQDTSELSPFVSNAAGQLSRSETGRRKSYGPDFEFKETNIAFIASPNPQAKQDDSDDDSDDGLFAKPLRGQSTTPRKAEQRPALTVDTDQLAGSRRKSVAFKTPTSNDGASAGVGNTGDESAGTGTSGGYDQRSFSGDSANWGPGSPEEGRMRPNSFVSDIWANRPDVEKVVEDLDKFFPGIDVDKPVIEEGGEASPMQTSERNPMDEITARIRGNITFGTQGLPLDFEKKNESDTLGSDESTLKANERGMVANAAKQQTAKSGGLGRMKSIREVAQRRNDVQRGPSVAYRAAPAVQPTQNSNIMRRKSTKMFGANIVQIKAGRASRRSVLEPIPQEDGLAEDAPKRQATFKIIRGQLIGKGTYGRVYLGMNATTGEFLAVKQVDVNPKAAAQEKERIKEMVKALDQEINTMQHLEHPNIVQYLGYDRQELSICIYLEYISGGSVGSCLRKHGKFEESVVRSLTYQTLSGLKYLHQEGILHRDLKADNILLDLDGTCKISDFGISKKSDDIYGNDASNSMQGSVFWMAPEVVRTDGHGYSAKVDIWSLGCVVLEMFAGKRPWTREEAVGAIFKLGSLRQAPPIPDDVSQTASIDGLNFMYDCFQVNPSDRPTAKTLLEHSRFCVVESHYNFFDTQLAAKLRNANMMPGS